MNSEHIHSSSKKYRVAVVVQRYGSEIVGGAEKLARDISLALFSRLGWGVEVFTTTAKEYTTWAPYYEAGRSMDGGVVIHRFDVSMSRNLFIFNRFNRLMNILFARSQNKTWRGIITAQIQRMLEPLWYMLQGPYVPALTRELQQRIKKEDFDFLLMVTYLYTPTIEAARIPGIKKILVSNLHDEPAAFFETNQKLFHSVDAVFANTEKELDLIKRIIREPLPKLVVLGSGVDLADSLLMQNEEKLKPDIQTLKNSPYILYLGRIDNQKGCKILIESFLEYKNKFPAVELKLVLAGFRDPNIDIPNRKDVFYAGFVSEEEKIFLINHSQVVVNLSRYESFSYLILEAIIAHKPCLVNRDCEVLAEYAFKTKTCFAVGALDSFEVQLGKALELIRSSYSGDENTKKMFEESKEWVKQRYSWEKVMQGYQRAVDEVMAPSLNQDA